MGNSNNKQIMAENIQYYMKLKGKTRQQVCNSIGVKYTTFTDWVKGNAYPRIDKIELMADYFGISKSDLVEEKYISSKFPKIIDYYNQLNDFGKREATKRVEELTNLPQYINKDNTLIVNAAHSISGASEEDRQFDENIMDDENF
jgi:hypothetical protein